MTTERHANTQTRPILTLKKTTEEDNPYGYDCIEFLVFNYDGKGGALTRCDGEFRGYVLADVDQILFGERHDGERFTGQWYEPIWS